MAETILIAAVIVAVLVFAWRRIMARGRKMAMLVSRGTAVTGTIVKKELRRRSKTHKACRLRYAFTTTGGMKYEREIEVRPKEFADYSEGQAIQIVYDPSDPGANALKSMVDAVRDASIKTQTGGMQ